MGSHRGDGGRAQPGSNDRVRPSHRTRLLVLLSLVGALVADASPAGADQQESGVLAATTTQWPWGLAVIAIVLAALLWRGIRALVRRRRRRRADPPFEPMAALPPVVKGALLPGPAHGPVPMLVPDIVIDLREPRVVPEPAPERHVIDLRTSEPEPAPEDAPAAEPGSERALIERVQRLTAQLRESARREVESLNLSPSAEERRLNQSRRTTRELAEALVLASKALDDQTPESAPPEDPAARPPRT